MTLDRNTLLEAARICDLRATYIRNHKLHIPDELAKCAAEFRALAAQQLESRNAVLEEIAQWYKSTGFYMDEDDVPNAIRALKNAAPEEK